ncbi:achaete-scute homolog 1a-like [Hydractinia symbiolongicarpus]|uniref:achaete-scute homolog 1a-like n=1 Tax=Hydractinia symbiolongicarpus TaxID=13093 RepID=UPI00254C667E|nr:achaete-scute homolog 1a-like [Hydractinia symbiolongicarpus]
MATESLFNVLLNLPTELSSFEQFQSIKLEDVNECETDSLGSCCSSPTQSNSSDCSSPTQASDDSLSSSPGKSSDDFFTFPLCYNESSEKSSKGKKASRTENKVKRNERERRRVRRLAEGFRRLRSVVPGNAKKLSKLQTLQTALQYMFELSETIAAEDSRAIQNQIANQPSMEEQMYSQDCTMYNNMSLGSTQVLSHPPMQWSYNDIPPQSQQVYPVMDCVQQNPAWYLA